MSRQNGRHLADDAFKRIFLNENVRISVKIPLKFVPTCPINNIPALVQIMAWRRWGDKPLSELMMVRLPTHICVTRPQWVLTKETTKLSTSIGQCYCWWWLCNHIHASDARSQGISNHGIDRLTQFAWTIYCGAGMGLVESKSIEMVLWKYGQNCTVTLKKNDYMCSLSHFRSVKVYIKNSKHKWK